MLSSHHGSGGLLSRAQCRRDAAGIRKLLSLSVRVTFLVYKDHNRYIMHVPLALELNENIFYYVTRETGQKENQLIGSYIQKSQLKVQSSTSLSKR